MADDPVAIASSPARTLAHFRRDPRATPSKNVQQARNSVIARSRSASLIGHARLKMARTRCPEVGRTGTDPVLDDLERPGGIELARHPGDVRDRPIALSIRLERLQGEVGAFAPRLQPGQSRAKAADRLSLVPCSITVRIGIGSVFHAVELSRAELLGLPIPQAPGAHSLARRGGGRDAAAGRGACAGLAVEPFDYSPWMTVSRVPRAGRPFVPSFRRTTAIVLVPYCDARLDKLRRWYGLERVSSSRRDGCVAIRLDFGRTFGCRS